MGAAKGNAADVEASASPERTDQFLPPNDKLGAVQNQVSQVKETMATNIELIIKRGDDLERMTHQSEGLTMVAKSFKDTTVKVKKQQRWSKYKWYCLCLVLFLLVFSGVITLLVVLLK